MTDFQDFSNTSRVLITGANGHVAQHVVHQLLTRPHASRPRVRATVRSEASADALGAAFSSHVVNDTLQIVRVADITAADAFTSALDGVTHIAHIASPLVVMPENVERDLLIPAIKGTTTLLKAAASCPMVESVVVTSSLAAALDTKHGTREGYTYTSKDWNPITYEQAADPELDLSQYSERYRPFVTYAASKKLAEKAAWDFYAEAKPAWRLSTVCPGYIAGPYVLPLSKGLKGASYSISLVWRTATSKPGDSLTQLDFVDWVDVRDVADVHIRALTQKGANGKRLLVGPSKVSYTDMAKVVQEVFGWETSEEVQKMEHWDVDMRETEEVLGIREWHSFDGMIADTVEQLRAVEGV